MEGPSSVHLLLMLAIGLGVPALICWRVARSKRAQCTWTLTQTKLRIRIGFALVLSSVLIFIFAPFLLRRFDLDPFPSQLGLICWILFLVGVYQISKAIYRKSDIKSAADSQEPQKPPAQI
jgi:hypothetical protein